MIASPPLTPVDDGVEPNRTLGGTPRAYLTDEEAQSCSLKSLKPRHSIGGSHVGRDPGLSHAGSRNAATIAQGWYLTLAARAGHERKAVFGDFAMERFRDIRPDIDLRPLRENLPVKDPGGEKRVNRLCGCNR